MKSRLETITNIVLIAVALLVVGVIFRQELLHRLNAPERVIVGQQIDPALYGPRQGADSIVLLLSTHCAYCAASRGFYRRLTSVSHKEDVIAAFVQNEDEGRAYLKDAGIQADYVVGSSKLIGKIPATPTILLVNRKGTIVNAWVGKLPSQKESAVLKQVNDFR